VVGFLGLDALYCYARVVTHDRLLQRIRAAGSGLLSVVM